MIHNRKYTILSLASALILQSQLTACGGGGSDRLTDGWPIDDKVYTTAEQQVLPVALQDNIPAINPKQVELYKEYGYSNWEKGPGLAYEKRVELAPAYSNAQNSARLLTFFSMSDIHISDKESPAQPLLIGITDYPTTGYEGLSSAYSPVILSSSQVLDAAVQTINVLHKTTPFDFGISLGDDVNNTQYNELRWFIDTMDGQVITPSSGANAGADDIDYQEPYKAAGLNKSIPWYQVIGNHDQFWMGSSFENQKTLAAHVSDTILNMTNNPNPAGGGVNGSGYYMGVIDGSTKYGDIIGAGPEGDFPTPPTVVPDQERHSLSTLNSSSLGWMNEFFNTTSTPVGHGFSQANLDQDLACYSFEPKSDLPLKVISLDDTCKGPGQPNYAAGCLDTERINWLRNELAEGQRNGKLMIIAAHIPINPQQSLTNSAPFTLWSPAVQSSVINMLHNYPNLILWISGHRHVNVVTPQPNNPQDLNDHPEQSFWEVETASLRDFPQQLRTFDIRRNSDNTISIVITNVDPAVSEDSPAGKSRGYGIGIARVDSIYSDTTSQSYNAELVKQLTPAMQEKIANYGSPM